jgi:hypothetical protein
MKAQWFAKNAQIARMGPFPTQEAAARALFMPDGNPTPGAFVWPETPGPNTMYLPHDRLHPRHKR